MLWFWSDIISTLYFEHTVLPYVFPFFSHSTGEKRFGDMKWNYDGLNTWNRWKIIKIPLPCCQCQQAFVLCLLLWKKKLPPHLDLSLHSAIEHFHEHNNIEVQRVCTFSGKYTTYSFKEFDSILISQCLAFGSWHSLKRKVKVHKIYNHEHHKSDTYTHTHTQIYERKLAFVIYQLMAPNQNSTLFEPPRPSTKMFSSLTATWFLKHP